MKAHNLSSPNRKLARAVAFYCLTPAVAFGFLSREKPRSVIITSGTLAPMDSLKKELKIDFGISQ